MSKTRLSSSEKVGLFRELFTGLGNVYGTYDPATGRVRQVKTKVTDKVIMNHLTGRQPYGVYLLTNDMTRALAVDFDEGGIDAPQSFVGLARQHGLSAYVERSKSKGYHVWMFFETSAVPAYKARCVAQYLLANMGKSQTEIFPKQDKLGAGVLFGNFINAPLFGGLVPQERTVFVNPIRSFEIYPDQWEFLAHVQRIPESALDKIIKERELARPKPMPNTPISSIHSFPNDNRSPFGLPPCARKMLAEGVNAFQRVSCFRLAVHMKRYGMPFDLTLIALKAWAQKNRPSEGKRIITDPEIEYQVRCAFEKTYRSFGCEDPAMANHCSKECPLYHHTVGRAQVRPGI
ncbi:hypothetical protein ACFL6U_11280 [Planctomycetota bacterium]